MKNKPIEVLDPQHDDLYKTWVVKVRQHVTRDGWPTAEFHCKAKEDAEKLAIDLRLALQAVKQLIAYY